MTDSLRWVKSSYSDNGGQCIEWAPEHAAATGEFKVRDSKNPQGSALVFAASAWSSFVGAVKGGEFSA
ncbi:DUF397 domain-containing protein [Streptomyces lydicus]|uniref:DUF397 domain-containing protein n=1 Tax=Streptomyces lydicus TaxID=47763 RepID=UPI0034377575